MIYDGDCNFCKFWVIRWRRSTAGRVEYLRSQDPLVAGRFPELARERMDNSVQFIETDGKVYNGAEAVFRSLAYSWIRGWPMWLYRKVPGMAPLTEWGYRFVARHRTGFSRLTRMIWRDEFPD
jgi:predicted DCC family thiol-disulfide oxidoreductase YuxK